ncbi:MAG: nicotinate-nucleotide--dimethylbenzimidazole phosphoribosyltransferase, partial [Propionibacteriaceae bacterium]
LAALGSADIAAGVGFLRAAARSGVPVLLDGIVSLAEASVAEDLEPGVVAWCVAGHRSTEPAQQLALDKLGLEPVLDLGLRLGEGTGALTALPVVRSAVLMLRDVALLADLSMRAEPFDELRTAPVDELRTAPVEAPKGVLRQAQGS